MHPIVTVVCTFTRRYLIEDWVANFKASEHDPSLTNLCFIVDCDEPYIETCLQRLGAGYRKCLVIVNHQHQPNEVRIKARRLRIADVKNQTKDLVNQCDGDYVLGFEDDTVLRDFSFNSLLQPLVDNPKLGFIEGVQCGRWGVKMIGAWQVDNVAEPRRAWTVLEPTSYYIDGGGFYGYATRKDLYVNHDYYSASTEPWGPDVNYGLWLRRKGLDCAINWLVIFGHRDHNKVLWPDSGLSTVLFDKQPSGVWLRKDVDEATGGH